MKPHHTDLSFKALVAGATLGVAVALAGCVAATAPPSAPVSKPASTAAPAPAPAPAAKAPAAAPAAMAAPSAGKGRIVFFRERKFKGAAVSFKVREGVQEIGKLSSGTFFIVEVPAGPHAFTVHSEAKDVLNLEVEPGETYYVMGSISLGLMVGRPNLAPSNEAAFTAVKGNLKDSAQKL